MRSLIALPLLALAAVSSAQSYSFVGDFVPSLAGSGAWSYGYMASNNPSGTLIPFNEAFNEPGLNWEGVRTNLSSSTPVIYRATTGTAFGVAPGEVALHGGPSGEVATARWTAPSTGSLTVSGAFADGNFGNVDTYVLLNGLSLTSATNIPGQFAFGFTIPVTAGDRLDFAVGIAGDFSGDSTPLTADLNLTPVPEPASMAVLGLGLAALKRRRKG